MFELKKIVTRSPARVSLGSGGDTDYYLKEIGWGCIVNASLSSLFYECEVGKADERVIEYTDLFHGEKEVNKLPHLRLDESKLDLIKATMSYIYPFFKQKIKITTNLPRESGLGGSSTLNIALALALYKAKGDLTNAEELARTAYYIERTILQVPGGYQDQWAAAYGRGLNLMIFKHGRVEVVPINISPDNLRYLEENSLLVFFSKRETSGSAMHKEQEKAIEKNKDELKKVMLEKRGNALQVKEALESGDWKIFAESVNKDWELKQKLSNKHSLRDDIYTLAIENGALAGRLCGAGGGGTYYFFCEEGKKKQVLAAIKDKIIKQLPFKIQRPHEYGNWYQI
jgi:D-glycero-alpha-D-manno-heptose-7-phosphate kinase